jgi:hypothetical protein
VSPSPPEPHEPGHGRWKLDPQEQRQVFALPARDRYGLFLQLTVDWEEAWGLHSSQGWVLSSGEDGRDVLPLWPHPGFAEACAHGAWEGTTPSSIALEELLDDLLPLLAQDGIRVAVFPTPQGEGVLVTSEELGRDLQAELALGG